MSSPQTVTVTGTFDGHTGTVRLVRSVWLRSSVDDSIVPPGRHVATLDEDGHFELVVPASDDSQWTPQGFSYRLTVNVSGVAPYTYDVELPLDESPMQLADLLPVIATGGEMYAPLAHTHDSAEHEHDEYAPTAHTHAAPDLSAYATTAAMQAGDTAVAFTANAAYDKAVDAETTADAALPKAGGEVVDSTLTIRKADGSSAIRMRSTGGAVDYDIHGDIIVGSWSGAGFTGTQTNLQRWRGDGTTLAGRTNFGANVYADTNYIDPDVAAQLGGKNDADAVRFVGYLAGVGNPTAGTWATGDVILRDDGWRRCLAGGTPGTWLITSDPAIRPADHGFGGWTLDPFALQTSTVVGTAGTIYSVRLRVLTALVTNIVLHIVTPGTALTAGQCFAALFDDAGNRLSQTADQATAWGTGGLKTMPLAAPQAVTPYTFVRVGFWFNGTTGPAVSRGLNSSSAIANAGIASNFRTATSNAGTTTTAPATLGALTGGSTAWWAAVS